MILPAKKRPKLSGCQGTQKLKEMKRQIPSLVVRCDYSLLVKCSQSKFHCLICASIYTNANKNWLTNGGQGHVQLATETWTYKCADGNHLNSNYHGAYFTY